LLIARLIIAPFRDYLYVLDNKPTKEWAGAGNVMQRKKTAETQVQQELSTDSATAFRSQVGWRYDGEPMTGAQAASLKRLAEEIREPHAFDAGLSKREAARRIDRLQEKLRLGELPPHTD
jgi:hypothetical protein